MTETHAGSPAPVRKRRSLLRGLLWFVGVIVVLVVAAYFVGTSSAFLKRTVLPRVSESLNADVTVSSAAIHPFSSMTLRDLKVTPRGRETLLTATEVRTRYSLFDILRGNLKIDEITLTSPTIHVVEQADGTSNLDPILKAISEEDDGEGDHDEDDAGEVPQINLANLTLSRGTVMHTKHHGNDQRDQTTVTNVNVTLSNLKNGDSGKLTLSAEIQVDNHPPAPGSSGVLQATVNGQYVFALSADLKPLSVNGSTDLKINRAEGAFDDFATTAAAVTADISPTEVKQIALKFQKAGEPLGELRASGPFSFEKSEGRLNVELLAVDRRVLNLVGAASGIDFGSTTLSSTNAIQLAAGGTQLTVAGQFNASRLQLTRTNQSTPTLDIKANYDVTVDTRASNAVLRALNLVGTQNEKPLIHAELSSPMTFSLGGTDAAVGDSSLNLTVTSLNLADWKPFLGDGIAEGTASLNLKLLSEQGGKRLTLDMVSQLANVGPVAGDKQLTSAALNGKILVQVDGDAKSLRGGIQLSNLVMKDPSGTVPSTPLEVKLDFDTTLAKETVELRQLLVSLTPTSRAKNQLQLQGVVDMTHTNAIQGQLKLTAESLDLTTYYDLFSGATNQTAKTSKPSETAPPAETPSQPQQESAATTLPFQNFVTEAAIGRLYLREMEITNFQSTIRLNGGQVLLKPLQFALNGAPVNGSADIDLSVPGYRYAVDFRADRIPVAPLANSFAPEYRGKAQGDLIANVTLRGAGTTGVNLQKHLGANIHLAFTNANIQLVGPKMRRLVVPIATALRLPELADSPITWLLTDIDIADGVIKLGQVRATGSAFAANTQGSINIAPVLDNSPIQRLPIHFALGRTLAARAGFKGSADTNNAYVDLGPIAHVTGTIGSPETKVDYPRIALLTGEQLIGGTAGEVLRSVGGAASGTNVVGNLIQGIGGLLGGKSQPPATNTPAPTVTPDPTNAIVPATNTAPIEAPAGTNQSPLRDLLKVLGPRAR
jgi:hypothetical protein